MTRNASRAAALLGGFLLFAGQTVFAAGLLPRYGGGPAVWTACLLFFQSALAVGYLAAHWVRSCRLVAAAGLAWLVVFLLARPEFAAPGVADPVRSILWELAVLAGAPFVLVAATSPLLQTLRADHRLYAWSNGGALVGLLFVSAGIGFDTMAVLGAAFGAWMLSMSLVRADTPPASSAAIPAARLVWWTALSAAGSALLSASTNQLCQEVFVMPMLWAAPLALYLLTWILAFRRAEPPSRTAVGIAFGLTGSVAAVAASLGTAAPLWLHLIAYPAALFFGCLAVHGELAASRPEPAGFTRFYLATAVGGALGAAAVALLAPLAMTNYGELYLALAACAALPVLAWRETPGWRTLPGGLMLFAAAVGLASLAPRSEPGIAEARRGFFGILKVTEADGVRKLIHGRVVHGQQLLAEPARPTAYYSPESAVGMVLSEAAGGARRVGVAGLGAGTLAAYGRPGDHYVFYEINPDVIDIARGRFSYLRDSPARIEIVEGDARLRMRNEAPRGFDVLVLDAFSSDAIPAHLLTREAFETYRRHLAPQGVLLIHISNRYLDLAPLIAGLAPGAVKVETKGGAGGASDATWMVINAPPHVSNRASAIQRSPVVWTDRRSSLWSVWK